MKLDLQRDSAGNPLPCYGCGHAASEVSYPGCPSGERPCLFCVRHTDQDARRTALAEIRNRLKPGQYFTSRYDNGPVRKDIGDQYISTDRLLRDVPEDVHVIT